MASYLQGAIDYAAKMHEGQVRKGSGEGTVPYIVHPIRVMKRLQRLGITDESLLAAAVLHDVVEDTPATTRDIEGRFGPVCAQFVDEMTKVYPGGDQGETRREYVKSFRSKSAGANVIKLADRLDNLTGEKDGLTPKYRTVYAAEGLAIVASAAQMKHWSKADPQLVAAAHTLSSDLVALCTNIVWGGMG